MTPIPELTPETLRELADGDDQMVWLIELGVLSAVVETMRRAIRSHAYAWAVDRAALAVANMRLQASEAALSEARDFVLRLSPCGDQLIPIDEHPTYKVIGEKARELLATLASKPSTEEIE